MRNNNCPSMIEPIIAGMIYFITSIIIIKNTNNNDDNICLCCNNEHRYYDYAPDHVSPFSELVGCRIGIGIAVGR